MLMTTKTAKRKLLRRLEGALLVAGVLSQAQLVLGQAIIDNGTFVQMGINAAGHLNVPGGTLSMPSSSTTYVGLRYIPTNGESTAPGCLCEGWGVANADPATGTFAGYANIASDGGVVGLVVQPGTGVLVPTGQTRPESVGSAFKSIVTTGNGRVRVTHIYHPSASAHLYQVDVTIENIGATPIGDLRYRRVMDWDIAPFTFYEWVEMHVGTAARLVRATSDGFLSANPLNPAGPFFGVPPATLVTGSADYSSGPTDQGSSFDFTFGSLAAGESTRFTIYYGAAGNRTDALIAVAAVRAQMYSLGIPSTSSNAAAGPATGGPHVFIFAFGGVGGTPVPSPIPTRLKATPGNQMMDLRWESTTDNILGWNVYVRVRSIIQNPWYRIPSLVSPTDPNAPTTTFNVTYRVNRNPLDFNTKLLENGVAYEFSVSAVSTSGVESQKSTSVVAVASAPRQQPPELPVVLVHGFSPGGSRGYWDILTESLNTLGWVVGGEMQTNPFSPVGNPQADFLTFPSASGDYYVINFRDEQIRNGIAAWGYELRAFLRTINDLRLQNGLPETKFIIVAHSAGGLAARYYTQFLGASDIAYLITYGTPHLGIDTALTNEFLEHIWGPALGFDITSQGLQELFLQNQFIHNLNSAGFRRDITHKSLLGVSHWCAPRFKGDGVVTETNQNMANVVPAPFPNTHIAIKSSVCHIPEVMDVVNILYAIPKKLNIIHGIDEIRVNLGSPAEIIVTDPLGQAISKNFNSISLSLYDQIEDGDSLHDAVTIPIAISGVYTIQVIPDPSALPTDTYSLTVTQGGVTTALAQNEQIQNIPSQGYAVNVLPPNQIPVANAGSNRTVRLGSLVTLNGGGSSDPDNGPGPLTFSWTKVSGPAVTLSGATTATPTFTPTVAGTYTFSLVVNDGQDNSASASVTITVPKLGDIDLDGDVDNNDLNLIVAARNTLANGPNDLRDLNGDGKIDALDSRKLVTLCTRPRCATQ